MEVPIYYDPYKEVKTRKITWDGIKKGMSPFDLIKNRQKTPGGLFVQSPYNSVIRDDNKKEQIHRINDNAFTLSSPLVRISSSSSPSFTPSSSLSSSSLSKNVITSNILSRKKRNDANIMDKRGSDQFFIVEEEKSKNTNKKKNLMYKRHIMRKNNNNNSSGNNNTSIKNGEHDDYNRNVSISCEHSIIPTTELPIGIKPMSNNNNNNIEYSVMGNMADFLIGRPSSESIEDIIAQTLINKDICKRNECNNKCIKSSEEEEKEDCASKKHYINDNNNNKRQGTIDLKKRNLLLSSSSSSTNIDSRSRRNTIDKKRNFKRNGGVLMPSSSSLLLETIESSNNNNNNNNSNDNNNREDRIRFKIKYEKFLKWINANSLITVGDLEQAKTYVLNVMNDLIYNDEKRIKMQYGYTIAALISTKKKIKQKKGKIERAKKRKIEFGEDSEYLRQKKMMKKYKRNYVPIEPSPLEMIIKLYEYNSSNGDDNNMENKNEEYKSIERLKNFLLTRDKYSNEFLKKRLAESRKQVSLYMNDENDIENELNNFHPIPKRRRRKKKVIAKGEKRIISDNNNNNTVTIPNLADMDNIYGNIMKEDIIETVKRNPEKIMKYTNEISLLWRLFLSSKTIRDEEDAPCSHFEQFTIGVLYTLAENDICIENEVIMERDEWLSYSLPNIKRLCDHYMNRLKRKEVAKTIQLYGNINAEDLTFSTKNRMYTSKVVSKGMTKVKKWLRLYDGESDGNLIRSFIKQNSSVEYIKLGNTQGNIHQAKRKYRKRPLLFM
jgi:hypothetical protein